jgi:hypothetical protein
MPFDRTNREAMIWLQDSLAKLGISTPVRFGFYDVHTKKAIARYQIHHKLLLTGTPDDPTIAHIQRLLATKSR